MIPLPLLSTFQDVIGYTIIKTFNSQLLVALFIIGVFIFILFWLGASTSVVFVIGVVLIMALSSADGLLPWWVFFLTVFLVSGLIGLAALHVVRR